LFTTEDTPAKTARAGREHREDFFREKNE